MPALHPEPQDLVYENTHRTYDFQCDDNFGIQCKNVKFCRGVLPAWWWDCRNMYICTNCDMFHGIIQEKDNMECPICLSTTTCVVLRCGHPICTECFKRCHFPVKPPQPKFPYSTEVEEEYDDDRNHPKWNKEYPLIQEWQQELDRWFDDQEEKFEREQYLRVCSLCRN